MCRHRRLTSPRDFVAVRREGKSWSNRLMVLVTRPNELGASRLGFSAGRRVGKAVVRNKIKRRLREAVSLARIRPGWDLVFIARQDASRSDFNGLKQSVADLLGRARVLAPISQGPPCSSEAD